MGFIIVGRGEFALYCLHLSPLIDWMRVLTYVYVWSHTYSKGWRINRVRLPTLLVVSSTGKMNISVSTCSFVPENLVTRDGFGSPIPRQPAHPHTQAESGAYLRDSSRVPRWCPFIYLKPPYVIGSVSGLSGHAIAYRWMRPRVCRHRASKPQGSSKRVLPWQVTMDPLI